MFSVVTCQKSIYHLTCCWHAGPIFRVAGGDNLEIIFKNTLEFDVNLIPNGVPLAENDTDPVEPGEVKTYNWNITDQVSHRSLHGHPHR